MTTRKTVCLPLELAQAIEKEAAQNTRNFSQQLTHRLTPIFCPKVSYTRSRKSVAKKSPALVQAPGLLGSAASMRAMFDPGYGAKVQEYFNPTAPAGGPAGGGEELPFDPKAAMASPNTPLGQGAGVSGQIGQGIDAQKATLDRNGGKSFLGNLTSWVSI